MLQLKRKNTNEKLTNRNDTLNISMDGERDNSFQNNTIVHLYCVDCIFISVCRSRDIPSYGSILVPLSSFGTEMSISAWRGVILSTAGRRDCTACSILPTTLTLCFMLTTQRLFIDTDHTLEKHRVICERTCREKEKQPKGMFRLKSSWVSGNVCVY